MPKLKLKKCPFSAFLKKKTVSCLHKISKILAVYDGEKNISTKEDEKFGSIYKTCYTLYILELSQITLGKYFNYLPLKLHKEEN